MNNKGMAISSILYTILILFLALLFGILGLISSSKATFDTLKERLYTDLNNEYPEVLFTINEEDSTKMDLKVRSRKYIDIVYLTTAGDVDENKLNVIGSTLPRPLGTFVVTQKVSSETYYLYLKDIHATIYKYQIIITGSGANMKGTIIPIIYNDSCAIRGNCSNPDPVYGLWTSAEGGELLVSWDELVNVYGLDIEKDCPAKNTDGCGSTILKSLNISGFLKIPSGITKIGKNQFRRNGSDETYLTGVEIPSTVVQIGAEAFNRMSTSVFTTAIFDDPSNWYYVKDDGTEEAIADVNKPSKAANKLCKASSGSPWSTRKWVKR